MFNLGPSHLLVLAVVGSPVLGPDKLPGLARRPRPSPGSRVRVLATDAT